MKIMFTYFESLVGKQVTIEGPLTGVIVRTADDITTNNGLIKGIKLCADDGRLHSLFDNEPIDIL